MTFSPQPWQGSASNAQKNRLNIHANHPFFLMHYPTAWDFVRTGKSGQWLPHFSELKEAPGINGVQQTKHGTDSKFARVHHADLGYTILDYQSHDYLARYPAKDGFYYTLKWAKPKMVGKAVFWSLDDKAYNAWRKSLIDDGVIDMPHPEIIELKIEAHNEKINRAMKNQHIPEIKNRIAGWEDELKALKAAKKGITNAT